MFAEIITHPTLPPERERKAGSLRLVAHFTSSTVFSVALSHYDPLGVKVNEASLYAAFR